MLPGVELRPKKGETFRRYEKRVKAEAKKRIEAARKREVAATRVAASVSPSASVYPEWQEVVPTEAKLEREKEIREAESAEAKKMLDVFNEAREAYYLKKKIEDNPHPIRSRLGLAWMFGFEVSECRDALRLTHQEARINSTWYKQNVEVDVKMRSDPNRARRYKVNVAVRAPKTAFAQAK
jgi:hypothetical protein